MYRKGEVYDEIKNVIIDIYIDYDIHQFPVDEKWLCRRMGVALIPYSAYDTDARILLNKKSKKGFLLRNLILHHQQFIIMIDLKQKEK